MKYIFYVLLAFSPCPAYSGASTPGCPEDANACAAVPAERSPLLGTSVKPGPAPSGAKSVKPVKNIAPQSVKVEMPAAPAGPVPPPRPAAASNPLWSLFVAGGLAGLYLYLKKEAGKRGRK